MCQLKKRCWVRSLVLQNKQTKRRKKVKEKFFRVKGKIIILMGTMSLFFFLPLRNLRRFFTSLTPKYNTEEQMWGPGSLCRHLPGPGRQGRWGRERDPHTSPPTQHWGPASGRAPQHHLPARRGAGQAAPGPAASRGKEGDAVGSQSQGSDQWWRKREGNGGRNREIPLRVKPCRRAAKGTGDRKK